PGDVFHIQGENKEYDTVTKKDDKVIAVVHHSDDSTHIGIVTKPGEPWPTVEGGGSDHVTRDHNRNLVPSSSPRGKWRFGNDDYIGKNAKGVTIERPVVGYVDVAKVGKVMALDPTPLPPGV